MIRICAGCRVFFRNLVRLPDGFRPERRKRSGHPGSATLFPQTEKPEARETVRPMQDRREDADAQSRTLRRVRVTAV